MAMRDIDQSQFSFRGFYLSAATFMLFLNCPLSTDEP